VTKAILAVILVPALASAADRKPQKTVVFVHGHSRTARAGTR